MWLRAWLLAFVAVSLVACDRRGSPAVVASSADPARARASASAAPAVDGPSDAMLLCLAEPGGTTGADVEVKNAQRWVRQLPKSTDKLALLGRAWVLKARASGDPGHYLNVKACADLIREREPDNRLAKELGAQVMLSQHRFAEAKDLCEQVLAKDPEAFTTLGVYSDVLFELGRIDEAITAADRMVSFKPNPASYTRVSFFQWLRGDTTAALESGKLAIKASADPGLPEPKAYALTQTAGFFWHRGDYPGADAGYRQALDALSDYPPALVGRGRVALALGEPKRAVTLLARAFEIAPHCETAWRLGDARAAAGDAAGAEAAYAKAVDIGKKTDPRTLALFYAVKNRDIPEAVRLAEAEMKIRPGIYTEDAYAWALFRAGRIDDAKEHSARAIRVGTRDASLWYHAGAIRLAAGDKKGGEKLVRDALGLSPKFDHAGAAEATKLLDALP